MKATTHTEVYRRYTGPLAQQRFVFLSLARAGIRTAAKKKLPLVLLLAPPAIATVIFSFVVYTGLALEAGSTPAALGARDGPASILGAAMMAGAAKQMIQAREQIVLLHLATNMFGLLLMAWYGAGLIAEDKRLGAHLLYFARPLTRLDYVLAKFLVVAFFGALGSLLPGLIVCTVATFGSHEWAFLKQQSDVIVGTVLLGTLVSVVTSSYMLAVSSLSGRKTFALAGSFGFVMLTLALAGLFATVQKDLDWQGLSVFLSLGRIATSVLDVDDGPPPWNIALAWTNVAATVGVSWIVIWMRVKRLEVVA